MTAAPHSNTIKSSWFERLGQILLGELQDREQLVTLLRDAEQRNLIDADVLAMIEGALQVSEMQVRDIMVPRSQMVVVPFDARSDEFTSTIVDSGHSRFPVIGESRDEVPGILLAKDMLAYLFDGSKSTFSMREVLRPAIFIPESKRLNVLLREFRTSRNHMAIVVDEYGGISGLVTIEDVIEQIVGEIDDEHDISDTTFIKRHDDDRFTVKALTTIEDFNDYFNTTYSDEIYDTFGGLLLKKFGHLPKRGETLNLDKFNIKILRADNRRIHLVRIRLNQQPIEPISK